MIKRIFALGLWLLIGLSMLYVSAFAKEEESFTITFDAGEYTIESVTIVPDEQNNTISKPPNPAGNSKCLEYWTKEGSDEVYDFNTPVTSSFTLVAHWRNDHSYEDIEIFDSPTCIEEGSKEVKCSVCGAEDTVAIEATSSNTKSQVSTSGIS